MFSRARGKDLTEEVRFPEREVGSLKKRNYLPLFVPMRRRAAARRSLLDDDDDDGGGARALSLAVRGVDSGAAAFALAELLGAAATDPVIRRRCKLTIINRSGLDRLPPPAGVCMC